MDVVNNVLLFNLINSFLLCILDCNYCFYRRALENQHVEGQPSLKELNMKYENMKYKKNCDVAREGLMSR